MIGMRTPDATKSVVILLRKLGNDRTGIFGVIVAVSIFSNNRRISG